MESNNWNVTFEKKQRKNQRNVHLRNFVEKWNMGLPLFRSIIFQQSERMSQPIEVNFIKTRKVEGCVDLSFSYMLQFVCRPENGGIKVNDAFDISWVDWLEFILRDVKGFSSSFDERNLMLNMSRNHFYLPPSFAFPFEFRPKIAIDFQFHSRAFSTSNVCVHTRNYSKSANPSRIHDCAAVPVVEVRVS